MNAELRLLWLSRILRSTARRSLSTQPLIPSSPRLIFTDDGDCSTCRHLVTNSLCNSTKLPKSKLRIFSRARKPKDKI
jgi:hypothetical protein